MADRHPLRAIARVWAAIMGSVSGVATALVTGGALTAGQGEAITHLFTSADGAISAVVGLIAAGSAVWSSFRTARAGEKKVTPVDAPMTDDGARLVPEAVASPPRQ